MFFRRKYIITVVAVCWLAGCSSQYNLATNQQETLLHGTEKEIKIGASVAQQFDANYSISSDMQANERVQAILERIVAVCDRQELVYTIKIIDEDKINAVSLPGGYIYIYKGLLDKVKNDDELAGVIAHEVGHITAKHGMKRLQASYGYAFLAVASVAAGDAQLAQGAQAAYMSVFLAYSREDEFQADELGIKYMKKAGYDPAGMTGVLKLLQEQQQKEPLQQLSYWRTHPHLSERISASNKAVTGQYEFKDYLNLIGNE